MSFIADLLSIVGFAISIWAIVKSFRTRKALDDMKKRLSAKIATQTHCAALRKCRTRLDVAVGKGETKTAQSLAAVAEGHLVLLRQYGIAAELQSLDRARAALQSASGSGQDVMGRLEAALRELDMMSAFMTQIEQRHNWS